MIDKEKYPKLYSNIESTIKWREQYLSYALKVQILWDYLPEEIKELEVYDIEYIPNTLSLRIKNQDGTIPKLKILGIQGLSPKVSSWSKKSFYSEGTGVLPDGTELSIHVSDIEEPEGCEIQEKTEVSTRYVLVCPQSGKEVT